jgi:hypothetical protein
LVPRPYRFCFYPMDDQRLDLGRMIEVHRKFSGGRRAEGLYQDKSGRICSLFVICDLVRR